MAQSGCRKSSQLSEVPWLPEVKLVASGRQAQHHTTHVDFMPHMRRAHLFSALLEVKDWKKLSNLTAVRQLARGGGEGVGGDHWGP